MTKEIVTDFITSLGKIKPPGIDLDLLEYYITTVVVDADSMCDFITGVDRYLKHTQTFQMGFMLHSLASILTISPLGNPLADLRQSVPNHAFRIDPQDLKILAASAEANKYEELCQLLLEPNSDAAKKLEQAMVDGRKKEKLDDGTPEYPLFDPLKTNYTRQVIPGEDLTEETEIKD